MPSYLIRRLLILGGIAILGIVLIQSYWVSKNWDLQDKQFDSTVHILLRKVAEKLAKFNESELPKQDLIQRQSSNTYVVNINSSVDASILEDYLYQEMEAHSLKTDFEYAVFDCYSNDLVYGNYCELGDEDNHRKLSSTLPKFDDLIYYFVVRFPQRESYMLSYMWLNVTFSVIAALAVLFFLYSIWVILQQKRLSELQKDFINNMTHEFKTPISSIKIAADVLSNHEAIAGDQRLSRYAKIITDQNQRLNKQVEKVLNIARLERGTFELKKEKFNIQRELQSIVHNERLRLPNGTIHLDVPPTESQIYADKLHFTNVVSNIIDNAAKYCTSKPEIKVSITDLGASLNLSIADNGIGISKENQQRLFEKFYRVPTGNVHDVKGFGLGLFYVKNIAKAHQWKIDVASEIDQGTTITLNIPKYKEDE